MAFTRQCPKCGLDLSGTTAMTCPNCGTTYGAKISVGSPAAGKWIAAGVQILLVTAFMLIFHFPRFMLVIFATLILLGTALSGWAKARSVQVSREPQRPVAHPTLFRILSLGVAASSLAFVVFLLFGFVIFMNAYSNWQRYEGQSYHRADFEVTRAYFQRGSKGGISVYASGTVDGQREWMDLEAYVPTRPRNEAELDEQVPAGTSIPIYLFPGLKGRSRVRVFADIPPADAYHHAAVEALKYGLGGGAISGLIVFVLLRLRAACYEKKEAAFAAKA
jgi:hypothetical protein